LSEVLTYGHQILARYAFKQEITITANAGQATIGGRNGKPDRIFVKFSRGRLLAIVEVSVDSMSDGRGLFLDEGISPGSTEVRILFKIGATGVPREKLQEMVDWVSAHSPVGTDVEKAVDVSVELELV